MQLSGLLFFLSILEAGSSAVEAVGPGRSQRSVFVLKYVLVYAYHLDSINFTFRPPVDNVISWALSPAMNLYRQEKAMCSTLWVLSIV